MLGEKERGIMNWQAIIRRYKGKHYGSHERETAWFAGQPTLRAAIEYAATATRNADGKRFDHQRRAPKAALQQAKCQLLQHENKIAACRTFEELMELIKGVASSIHGLGELYIYDTALRIGSKLGIQPDRVYLHRGTRDGAKRLGYSVNRLYIEMHELPEALRKLSAAEVEDILCIFKDHLGSAQPEHPADTNKASCR